MTRWSALVPMRLGLERKTRLAARFSALQREHLATVMAGHVLAQLHAAEQLGEIRVLSPVNPALPGTRWIPDHGRGLNRELGKAWSGRTLIIHADLPLLHSSDVDALIAAAETAGAAIAPDHVGTGTNALAIAADRPTAPSFGAGSFARHLALWPTAAVVRRPGLALDLDTPDDLAAVLALGSGCIAGSI